MWIAAALSFAVTESAVTESAVAARSAVGTVSWPKGTAVVTYGTEAALAAALEKHPATVVRRLPALHAVEVLPAGAIGRFAAEVSSLPGIGQVERRVARRPFVEPALAAAVGGAAIQWQFAATRADLVPEAVLRAAASQTVAVIDTGADLAAPDLAAKTAHAYSIRTRSGNVADRNGHGTFVASLAGGSTTNGDGIAGGAGDARLVIVQAGGPDGSFSDVEEAAAIVWAVDHGARVLNLSLGGRETSAIERRAVDYAVSKGALLVAAVGNDFEDGSPLEYPAALLQPPGSRGVGGAGLAVGASNRAGARARFSNTGTYLSLAAPGDSVFAAVSALSPASRYPRTPLPGSLVGQYGFGSGTSFAAPQVAGAAALVWAANPALRADEVASILEQTASGHGVWNAELGYGVLDVAAAVARAQGTGDGSVVRLSGRQEGRRVTLSWAGQTGTAYRLLLAHDGKAEQVLISATSATTAVWSLTPGSMYTFVVQALDASGAPSHRSTPWSVSLRQASSSLRLTAKDSPSRGVRLDATLKVVGTNAGGRSVVLESFDGKRWARAAAARTDLAGRVGWDYTLDPGSYRVRARFAGSDDIAAATSRAVNLEIR